MARLRRQILIIVLLLGPGAILLVLYRKFIGSLCEYPLFIAAVITITLGSNRFTLIFERLIRHTDEIRFPFARILYSAVPCIFIFYQFYRLGDNDFIPKVILGVLYVVSIYFSMFFFSGAIHHTEFGRRRINVFYGVILLVIFSFLISLISGNTGVLLLLPFSIMLLWIEAIRFGFFRDFERRFFVITTWLTGTVTLLFATLLLFDFLTPEIISTIYNNTITIYGVLFALTVAFTIYVVTQRNRRGVIHNIALPVQGLAFFCSVLFGVTLLGVLTGTQLDNSIFLQGTTLAVVFSSKLSAMTLFRVLIINFVLISFPFILIYSYAVIRQSLTTTNH